MERRLKLQALLEETIGSRNVYYQPPESLILKYPCIVYSRGPIDKPKFANNRLYSDPIHYVLIFIDKNPDSEILEKLKQVPLCSYERHYTSNNLNHDIYNIYY